MNKIKLYDKINNIRLKEIGEKVYNNIPVNIDDGLFMLNTNDIIDLGAIADYIRKRYHGRETFYSVNLNLNYTNICELRCPLCAYSCDKESDKGFVLSMDDVLKKLSSDENRDIDEVHIVGGLHRDLKIDYFEELIKTIKEFNKDLFVVAFTAVEYDYFAKLNNIPVEEVFKRLISAGLNALPGGGAEIFSPEVREIIAPLKIPGKRWIEVMRVAHNIGLKTNATMLYNHYEEKIDIIDHLSMIRDLQDETGGFKTFVPLKFHNENINFNINDMTTGYNDVRIYSTSRIFLHNIPHIKGLWMYIGEKMAQILQSFGVDDIAGTYRDEKVVHSAGAATPDYGEESHLRRLISKADFLPVRVNAGYNRIVKGHVI